MPTTTPLNVLDELYLHLNREDEPWSVHVEIRVDGPIDVARLEAAVREATGRLKTMACTGPGAMA